MSHCCVICKSSAAHDMASCRRSLRRHGLGRLGRSGASPRRSASLRSRPTSPGAAPQSAVPARLVGALLRGSCPPLGSAPPRPARPARPARPVPLSSAPPPSSGLSVSGPPSAADERVQLQRVTRHAESLPPGARQVFRSGHRLSRAERDARLAALDPEVRRARGLRFSDEPVDMPAELETALLRAWERLPKPVFRVRDILAVLWDRADPLMLELWADTLGQGANLLYGGPRDRGYTTRNRASALARAAELASLTAAESAAGWLSAWPATPSSATSSARRAAG